MRVSTNSLAKPPCRRKDHQWRVPVLRSSPFGKLALGPSLTRRMGAQRAHDCGKIKLARHGEVYRGTTPPRLTSIAAPPRSQPNGASCCRSSKLFWSLSSKMSGRGTLGASVHSWFSRSRKWKPRQRRCARCQYQDSLLPNNRWNGTPPVSHVHTCLLGNDPSGRKMQRRLFWFRTLRMWRL